jgi:hypothetical protein
MPPLEATWMLGGMPLEAASQARAVDVFNFEPWYSGLSASSWHFFGSGDFTGDGRIDIVAYESNSQQVLVGKNTGSGFNFEPWYSGLSDSSWHFFGSGDFTGDGRIDIVAYESNSQQVLVGRNTGLPPEGYAWPLSASPGEAIDFRVSGVASPRSSSLDIHTCLRLELAVLSALGWNPPALFLSSRPCKRIHGRTALIGKGASISRFREIGLRESTRRGSLLPREATIRTLPLS